LKYLVKFRYAATHAVTVAAECVPNVLFVRSGSHGRSTTSEKAASGPVIVANGSPCKDKSDGRVVAQPKRICSVEITPETAMCAMVTVDLRQSQ
jgi:hypothetical protein